MDKPQYKVSISVVVLKEGNSFIAYSPALDLSTVGDTFDEAKLRFQEALRVFFEEIIENGTANKALMELGWQREDKHLVPPVIVGHQTESFSVNQFLQ
jgi:predicted RNase H-like HicB family nuclease